MLSAGWGFRIIDDHNHLRFRNGTVFNTSNNNNVQPSSPCMVQNKTTSWIHPATPSRQRFVSPMINSTGWALQIPASHASTFCATGGHFLVGAFHLALGQLTCVHPLWKSSPMKNTSYSQLVNCIMLSQKPSLVRAQLGVSKVPIPSNLFLALAAGGGRRPRGRGWDSEHLV